MKDFYVPFVISSETKQNFCVTLVQDALIDDGHWGMVADRFLNRFFEFTMSPLRCFFHSGDREAAGGGERDNDESGRSGEAAPPQRQGAASDTGERRKASPHLTARAAEIAFRCIPAK